MKLLKSDPHERPGKIVQGMLTKHILEIPGWCVENDRDRVILITGVEGMGKSGVRHVGMELMDPKLDIAKQVHWTGAPYKRASETLPPGRPIAMDELIRVAMAYKYMANETTDFADYVYTNRHRKHPQLLCHPDIETVDPRIRWHRAWEEWKVVRRYDTHAVVNVRQLRDENTVFESPKHLFSGTMPKPTGPKWDLTAVLKERFTTGLATGKAGELDLFTSTVERMKDRLGVFA